MFALVDCNNFYASCERVFEPSLDGKAIAVLSNNDGCVVARSNEAKSMGVAMGVPYFKVKDLIKEGLVVKSSNYALYADMSQRVMNVLQEFAPRVEVYSIDEAFLDLTGMNESEMEDFAFKLRKTILKWVKIPVSVGIARTKTLAKMANKMAKKGKGVCSIITEKDRTEALAKFEIGDVWGVGSRYEKGLLQPMGIKTALDFCKMPSGWVKSKMSIVGLRTHQELNGISCIPMLAQRDTKENICTSRSFGKMVNDLETLSESVSEYAYRCSEKLRKQGSCATLLNVFIHTNHFRQDLPQYSRSYTMTLPVGLSNGPEIVATAKRCLKKIYKEGFLYKKAGVIVMGLVPNTQVQGDLFDDSSRATKIKVSLAMDKINGIYGRDTVKLLATGIRQTKWAMSREFLSPNYTTQWQDIPKVKTE